MTQPSKLKIIQTLPTPSEMSQVIPTLRALNRKILELEKKVSSLEKAAAQQKRKTGIFKLF